MLRTGLILAALLTAAPTLADEVVRDIPVEGNVTIRCTITTPEGADLKQPLPVIVVFPSGEQNHYSETVARAMFYTECTKRGWAMVIPRPPEGQVFFAQTALYRPLIEDLDKVLVAEGGKYHVAGSRNGGRSAINFGLEFPTRTASIAAFPGALTNTTEAVLVEKLKGIPIRLWVGGDDTVAWVDAVKIIETYAARSNNALNATATVMEGQGRDLQALTAATVLDELEKFRTKEGTVPRENLDALATLDALHAAASKADFDAYFALYTPDAVFLGTDATERWTVEEFKAYTKPHFEKGKKEGKGGWTYIPRAGTRHVTVDPCGTVAFFDELLDNESYGTTRGTGVLRKVTTGEGEKAVSKWMVAQYSLSIPIPNPLAKRVAQMVKTEEKKTK